MEDAFIYLSIILHFMVLHRVTISFGVVYMYVCMYSFSVIWTLNNVIIYKNITSEDSFQMIRKLNNDTNIKEIIT